jgi:hypothetical protein
MKKQIAFILFPALCAPVMAEPVLYVCERPTWRRNVELHSDSMQAMLTVYVNSDRHVQ